MLTLTQNLDRWKLALTISIVTTGFLAPSIASGDDALPEVGTWEITLDAGGGGNPFKATMAIVRQDGNRVFGVIEWSPAGPTKTLELFSATADEARGVIRIDGREEHTAVPDMFPARYEARLGAGGRELREFVSTGMGSTGATGTARWIKATLPRYSPAVEASLNLTGERPLLYQQLSAHYSVQGESVKLGTDYPLLRELAGSSDRHVGDLARLKLYVQEMYEQSVTKDAAAAAEWARGERNRRDQVYLLLAKGLAPGPSLSPVVDLMNSIGMKQAFDRRRAEMEMACIRVAAANYTREAVRADYQARHGTKSATLPGKVTAGFKPEPSGLGWMTFRNDTGKDLHNAFFATRMTVDQNRLDQYARENDGTERLAGLFLVAVGVDSKNVRAINNFESVADKYFRLDKGSPGFVPRWPKGSVVEVPLGMMGDLSLITQSVGAWVGTDEGQSEVPLDINQVRKAIPAEPKKPAPRSKRAR